MANSVLDIIMKIIMAGSERMANIIDIGFTHLKFFNSSFYSE